MIVDFFLTTKFDEQGWTNLHKMQKQVFKLGGKLS